VVMENVQNEREMPEVADLADMLLAAVTAALAHGVEHYDAQGRRLATTQDVLEALRRDGVVQIGRRWKNEEHSGVV
jgi:hypothetical protein